MGARIARIVMSLWPPAMRGLVSRRAWCLLAIVMAASGLAACADSKTHVCINGIRCPEGMMCAERDNSCAPREEVLPCIGKGEDDACAYHGGGDGICRSGICEREPCEIEGECNDTNPCTIDTCDDGSCQHEELDGTSCDDGDFCNGADTCVSGACIGHGGDPCTRGNTYCDPKLNACAGCTDDLECPDSALGEWGDCVGGADTCALDGVQSRPAVTFACEGTICQARKQTETRTCQRSTDGLSCVDGDGCTENDECAGGSCQGQAKRCDDGNECTAGSCSADSGQCQFPPVPFGTPCGAGHCDGLGKCVTCANVGAACNTGNPCEQGEIRCVDGAPECVAVGVAAAGTVCRAAAGGCDLPEVCNGVTTQCPTDAFQVTGTECRADAGVCDVAETCTGTSALCPANAFESAGTECRGAAGACDVAETCTGSSASCPADALDPAGTVCRGAVDVCDAAETCTGSSATCPANALDPAGTECRGAAGDCDVAETCTGSSVSCPADALDPAGTLCRGAAGDCDVAETCTGTSAVCPANALDPAGTLCRGAAGVCDVAETCTGTSVVCPADALVSAGTLCRGAAGVCDVAETCTGSSATCPTDALDPAGTVCRPAADACDIVETCTGASVSCPVNGSTCSGGEYCFSGTCVPQPRIDARGGESDLCADQGLAHPFPAFASRVVFTGRPNAPFRYVGKHVSCLGASPVDNSKVPCDEGTVGQLDPAGRCTYTLANNVPLTDCPATIAGRWELFVEIDGVESNHDFLNIFNSTVSCPMDPPPTTCSAASSFCPITGPCNAINCPPPPPLLGMPEDEWVTTEDDAAFSPLKEGDGTWLESEQ